MKITVLVPSEEYRNYAGARIRYGRLGSKLSQLGVDLDLEDVSNFMPADADCDVLLISKCHDARSLIAAEVLSRRGRLVGVDLFDDYFSQTADSRLVRFRNWLTQLFRVCNFALCSTPAMAKVARGYRDDLHIHVVNDPAEDVGLIDLPGKLSAKLKETLDRGVIQLAWFGVGDNPYFKVGLSDLAAYGHQLGMLRRGHLDVELTVLTNTRALDAYGLELIRQLPVRTAAHEWTLVREQQVLAEAFACFLPVNAQDFSSAKSLNRAVTAFSAACQIISVGYPLYEPFGDLIYREPHSFLADLTRGQMRLSAKTIPHLDRMMKQYAWPAREAIELVRFIEGLAPLKNERELPLVLIHGHVANGATHKLIQSLQGFSVASPFCTDDMNFDVLFRREAGRVAMFLSQTAADRLEPGLRRRLRARDKLLPRKLWELTESDKTFLDPGADSCNSASLPLQLASYRSTIEDIRTRIIEAFGPCRMILSENSPLPFDVRTETAGSC